MMKRDTVPYADFHEYSQEEMIWRSREYAIFMRRRRTVRHFSDRPVSSEVIEQCISAAASAPSGANKQPWHFVAVSKPSVKREIRMEAEKVERDLYGGRASDEWLSALSPLGTGSEKPFLEEASTLIVIFEKRYSFGDTGEKIKHYYTSTSVGIATGILISAVHNAGLVSLPYTPSPMAFLNRILARPDHEKPFLLLVVGYPAENVRVPDIQKKPLSDVVTFT